MIRKTVILTAVMVLSAVLAWLGSSSVEPDVIIRITPAPKSFRSSESSLLKPDSGWVLTVIKSNNILAKESLVLSDGVDHDVTLNLSRNYEAYLDFSQKLKSIGVRVKNVNFGMPILLRWKTLRGSGISKISETDEIEIPL